MVDMRTREGRQSRETETRDAEVREKPWQPASKLPDPLPRDGIRFRWVRTSTMGQTDATNVSMRFREGWVPVKKADHPDLALMTDFNSKFPDNVEVGGLLLCQIEEKLAVARQRHYEEKARNQVRSADHNFMRESDPRMPVLKPERTTRTTWGNGNAPK